MSTPSDALRLLETSLMKFAEGDELFITARAEDSTLSMWRTESRAAGLYWCASALTKLWRANEHVFSRVGGAARPVHRPS